MDLNSSNMTPVTKLLTAVQNYLLDLEAGRTDINTQEGTEWVKFAQLCLTLYDPMDYTVHGILQARILEWVAVPFSRGSSQPRDQTPGLLHCKWIIYQLNHKGSSRILEWVVYPISSRSSWPRNRTGVSCIKGRFFTNWAIREAPRREVDPIMLINSAVRWLHAEYKCLARVIT